MVDLNTFQGLASIPVPDGMFDPRRLVRWGEDGLAILDDDEIWLICSPIVGR